MAKPLPKLKKLEYSLDLPLSRKKVIYRPYNVEDEKLLLAAAESKDTDIEFYLRNTFNVLRGTIVNDVIIDELPSVEVALYMLHLRGKSVGEVIDFSFKEGDIIYKGSCNTSDFYVQVNPEFKDIIQLQDDIWIKLSPINFAKELEYSTRFKDSPTTEVIFESIYDSIHSIFNNDDTWVVGEDITREEAIEFVNGAQGVSSEFYSYLKNRPILAVECTMEDGTKKIVTSEQADFLSSRSAI